MPERKQQPYTYNGLCEVIRGTLPENPPSNQAAGYDLQWGGEFDGKERVFVGFNWGRGLQTLSQERAKMEQWKQLLDARQEKDLEIVLHPMRDARPILIVQSV